MKVKVYTVGVGYDTLGANKLVVHKPIGTIELIDIDDTREGWVEAVSCLIDSYLEEGSSPVDFTFDNIRKYGETIRGFGGVASGPEPLRQGLNGVRDILSKRSGNLLQVSDIVDIMDLIGKLVVAGNVRRSALLSLGSVEDSEFTKLKDWNIYPVEMGMKAPDELLDINATDYKNYNSDINSRKDIILKYAEYPWSYKFNGFRWASNNSIYATPGMDYSTIVDSIATNGEPGLFWLDNAKYYGRMKDGVKHDDLKVQGVNPCSEIQLESYEVCNLNENYPANHNDYWDFQRTLKFSYLYSKAITLLGTHWEDTNAVIARNRRIGCSVSGIQELFIKQGRFESLDWLDKSYDYIKYLDKKYSDWLGVPKSIRKTAIKPSGTVSLLAGALPGIHHPESTSYYRLIRVSSDSQLIEILKKANYRVEPSATDAVNTSVVYFPIVHDEKLLSKKDISIWRQFKDVADVQRVFADNMVSVTVTFGAHEVTQIPECLSAFDTELKSVSLLPLNEHGYIQAPYTNAPREEVIEYSKTLLPLDFSSLVGEGDNAEANKFCSNDSCEI